MSSLEIETHVPTRLVERRTASDGSYGSFTWVRQRASAPGVLLADAIDRQGQPWLLQVVRTRSIGDDAERLARQHLEHVVGLRTAELLDEPELGLYAHGAVDEPDGTRALYWVLRWIEPDPAVDASVERVLRAALALARRLESRHARGRGEPLLSPEVVVLAETPVVMAFPLFVAPSVYTAEMRPPPLAPEERVHGQPALAGDLWRLGEVLRAWAERAGATAMLAPLVAALLEADPARRLTRPSQVVAELEALAGGRSAPTTTFSALDPQALSALLLEATADSTKLEPASALASGAASTQPELLSALGLAPSPASIALSPYAPDVSGVRLRSPDRTPSPVPELEPGEPARERTVVRTRPRPVIERDPRDATPRPAVFDTLVQVTMTPVAEVIERTPPPSPPPARPPLPVVAPIRIVRGSPARRISLPVAFAAVGLFALGLGVTLGALLPR